MIYRVYLIGHNEVGFVNMEDPFEIKTFSEK